MRKIPFATQTETTGSHCSSVFQENRIIPGFSGGARWISQLSTVPSDFRPLKCFVSSSPTSVWEGHGGAFFLLSFSLPLPLYLSLSLSLFLRLPFLVLFICLFLFPLLFLFLCLSLSLSPSLQAHESDQMQDTASLHTGFARENAVEPKVPESAGTLRDRPERAPRARDQAVFRPSRGNETRGGGAE